MVNTKVIKTKKKKVKNVPSIPEEEHFAAKYEAFDYTLENMYAALYISDRFNVPCPENFVNIVERYEAGEDLAIERLEDFAKLYFNKEMGVKFEGEQLETEILYFIRFIREIV